MTAPDVPSALWSRQMGDKIICVCRNSSKPSFSPRAALRFFMPSKIRRGELPLHSRFFIFSVCEGT